MKPLNLSSGVSPAFSSCNNGHYNSGAFRSCAVQGMLEPSTSGGSPLMSETLQPEKAKAKIKRCCPDCGTGLVKRSSSSQHPLMSKTILICKNPVCGASFSGVDEITHRLSPSSRPNPAIQLPFAPSALRRGVLQELDLPAEPDGTAVPLSALAQHSGAAT